MKKLLLLSLAYLCPIFAQTGSITSPTASQSISGTSFQLTVTFTAMPNLASVEYLVNSERACIVTSQSAPLNTNFACNWNTYYVANGTQHYIQAIFRDDLGNTILSSASVTFTVANLLPENNSTTCTPGTPTNMTWSGTVSISCTVTGTGAGNSKAFTVFIDGLGPQGGFGQTVTTNNATQAINVVTTRYYNGVHKVAFIVYDNNSPISGVFQWGMIGQWGPFLVNFSNAATPLEVRANNFEFFLCTSAQSNCPNTATLTGLVYNTDNSTTALIGPTFSSSNTAVATINASGVITPVAVGSTNLTITDTGGTGLARTVWVFVKTVNTQPHFGSDESIQLTYNPNLSIYVNSVFQSGAGFTESNYGTIPFATDYCNSGHNTFETGIWQTPGNNQAAYQASQTSYTSSQEAFVSVSPCPMFIHLTGDGMMRGTPDVFNTTRGASASFTPSAVQFAMNLWHVSGHVMACTMVDEVSSIWGHKPLQGTVLIGTNGFNGNITCTMGANCVVGWTDFSIQNGNNRIIITGSGDANLDYNTGGNALPYTVTNIDNNTFSFPTPAGVGTHTYTAISNPGLSIQAYVAWTYDASGNACPDGGSSLGPCTNWVQNNAWSQFMGQARAVTGPKLTWASPVAAYLSHNGEDVSNWSNSSMADYGEVYWGPNGTGPYLPQTSALWDLRDALGTRVRATYNYLQGQAPILIETLGIPNVAGFQGYTRTISSCSSNIITTTTPHGITNIVFGVTRAWISGSVGGTCDGNVYILSAPTATTLRVSLAASTFAGTGNGGTLTFQDGTTFGVQSIVSTGTISPTSNFVQQTANCPNNYHFHRGQTFTVSGSSLAGFNNNTFVYGLEGIDSCNQFNNVYNQIPNYNTTGGTITLLPTEYMVRGQNWVDNGDTGPKAMFASVAYALMLRGAGQRAFGFGADVQSWDPTIGFSSTASASRTLFNSMSFDNQIGIAPKFGGNIAQDHWHGHSMGAIISKGTIKYTQLPSLNSPDYGQWFETSARSDGSTINTLMILGFNEESVSCTADLSPYVTGGFSTFTIYKYYVTWENTKISTLSPGITSDTMTCDPGAFRMYIVTSNVVFKQPKINLLLSNITNATKISFHYNYQQYPFRSIQTTLLPSSFDAGNGSNITLPVDQNLGPVNYSIDYLDVNGKILAAGLMGTL